MTTFLDLQTRVSRRVIDLPTSVQTEVPLLINEAIKSLQTDHNFKVMEATQEYTTTVASHDLGCLPADFKEYRHLLPYRVSNTDLVAELSVQPDLQNAQRMFADATGSPQLLVELDPSTTGGKSISVFPYPDGYSDYDDGEYRIYIPYYKYLAPLSGDTDTNWFTNNAVEFIVNYATGEAFALDWDEDRMALWMQRAENKRKQVVLRDKHAYTSNVTTLVPHLDGREPRTRM